MAAAEDEQRDMELGLMKEVLNDWVTSDANFLHKVRNTSGHPFLQNMPDEGASSAETVDQFAFFLVPILAQFAGTGIPPHGTFKAALVIIAKTYGIFQKGTRMRVVKDWAGHWAGIIRAMTQHAMNLADRSETSRKPNIEMLKRLIHKVTRGEEKREEPAGETISSSDRDEEDPAGAPAYEEFPDSQPHPDDPFWERYHNKESAPELLQEEANEQLSTSDDFGPKIPLEATASAPSPAAEVCSSGPRPEVPERQAFKESRGPLLAIPNRLDGSLAEQVQAMQDATPKDDDLADAQRKVAKGFKRPVPNAGQGGDGDDDDGDEPSGGKKRKGAKPKAKGKARGKAKAKAGTEKEGKPEEEKGEGEGKDEEKEEEKQTQEKSETSPDPAQSAKPATTRGAKMSAQDLWKLKEPILKEAKIPIPEHFSGKAKSFTLKPADPETQGSLGILFEVEQIYAKVPCDEKGPLCTQKLLDGHKIKLNNSSHATLSVAKHGGWTACFAIAQKVAMWNSK